jgi:hypothetical protein
MFLLMPHRNSRQMRVVRLDAKANKRKIADTFLLASLISRAFAAPNLVGKFARGSGRRKVAA